MMGKTSKMALIVATCVVLYAVVGFFVAPFIIRSKVESILTERLGHPVTVKEVRLNPFALSLTVRGFAISEHDAGPLLGFEELYVNVELASVVKRALTFSAIRLQQPYALAHVRKNGSLNLLDLRPSAAAPEPQPDSATPGPPGEPQEKTLPGIIIELLQIDRGRLTFRDDSKPTPFTAEIVPITLALQNFSTKPDSPDSLSFSAEVGPGEKVEWRGTLYVQPLQSDGTLTITGLKVRPLWTYVQDLVKFEITDGFVDVTASYQARSDRDAFHASVKQGAVKLTKFALGEKGAKEPLVTIPEFTVDGIEADLATRQAQIAAVRSRDARISGWLDKDRRTIFQILFAVDANEAAPAQEPPPQAKTAPSGKPWLVKINEVNIQNYGIALEDRMPPTPARHTLDPLNLKLANVTSQLDAKVDLDLSVRVNESGTLAVTGGFTVQPPTADLDLDMSKIALAALQPYVDTFAQLTLNGGSANLKGHLSYGAENGTKPLLRYDGRVSVTSFLTRDKLLGKDFLKWDEVALNGLKLDVDPTRVTISEIVTRRPYLRLIIGQDRTTNVQAILTRPTSAQPTGGSPPPPSGSTKKSAGKPLPVRVGAIRIIEGSTHFADYSIKPVIDTGIFGLNGAIKGLSSKDLSRADVAIEGKVDKYAPVSIKGKINPLTSDAFTDVVMSIKNVELTTVSPYSTKFAGYPIQKGKISLDLSYKLAKNALEAENKVIIDQLTLGEEVESPDATSLPVKLAIALLQDRNGVIDIDLPVRGDLNDPEFGYGKVVLNVLVNLVTKAVTSPFNMLAGLAGGSGDELSAVAFPVGSAELPAASEAHLKTLAKALADRPGLRLEVTGAADPQTDRTALAEARLRQELLALRQQRVVTAGKPDPAAGKAPTLTPSEEAVLVEALYVKKFGALPSPPAQKDAQTQGAPTPEAVPVAELKARLIQTITVEESEIRSLAQDRAKRIQDFLVAEGGLAPERLFLVETTLDSRASGDSISCKLGLSAG